MAKTIGWRPEEERTHPLQNDGRATVTAAENVGGPEFAVYAAVTLSLLAALVHLWMAPQHFLQWWGYGAFFLAAALAQGLYAVALLRWPERSLSFAGIGGNLAIIALYMTTHTSGVPLGPHAGKVEDAGPLDMAATTMELALIILLVTLLEGAARRRAINALLLVGAAFWALKLSGILF